MRCQRGSLSAAKSKSPDGCCIARGYRFTGFVELFAPFYDPDRSFGHAAKDRDHWSQLLTPICPKRHKAGFFWCSSCLLAEVKLRFKSRTIEKSGEPSLSPIFGLFLLRFWVEWVCRALSGFCPFISNKFLSKRGKALRARSCQTGLLRLRAVCLARGFQASWVGWLQQSATLKRYTCSSLQSRICLSAKSPTYFVPASAPRDAKRSF